MVPPAKTTAPSEKGNDWCPPPVVFQLSARHEQPAPRQLLFCLSTQQTARAYFCEGCHARPRTAVLLLYH